MFADHAAEESYYSPHLRTNFPRANVGRPAPGIGISQKASAAEAYRRIVGNRRSHGSAERSDQWTTARKDVARTVDATPRGNLWRGSRHSTFSAAYQDHRCAGKVVATGAPG